LISKRTGDLWNTRRETQIRTKLDQPPWKNWQDQAAETRSQLQTTRLCISPLGAQFTKMAANGSVKASCVLTSHYRVDVCRTTKGAQIEHV